MSDPVPALQGAGFEGPVAWLRAVPPRGMVTLRGDLSDPRLGAAVHAVTNCVMPARRGITRDDGGAAVAWMSPDEVLILVDHAAAGATVASLREALAGGHHLAVDVSDARAVLEIGGPGVREVLARLCPADLSPAAFGPGEVRRTRLAQVPAAFWMDTTGTVTLVCFRSVARYAFDVLQQAAAQQPIGVFDG